MIKASSSKILTKYVDTCVLILASGDTRSYYSRWRQKSFSYLNSGSKLATKLIKEFYDRLGIKVFIGINNLNDYKNIYDIDPCQIVQLPSSDNPCDSLRHFIANLTGYDKLILNPVTVLPSFQEFDSNTIYLSDKKNYKENWSAVDFLEDEARFYFRDVDYPDIALSYPFTGIVSCEFADLRDALSHVNSFQNNDIAYLAFYLYSIFQYQFKFIKWLDLDHETTHCDAKLHAISSRDCHALNYIKSENIITKEKKGANSLYRDYLYYQNIPTRLRRYFPCLIDYTSDSNSSKLSLEYIPYPTLSELYLHGDLGRNRWISIVEMIKNISDKFYNTEPVVTTTNLSDLYSKKLQNRINELLSHARTSSDWLAFNYILNSDFILNGKKFPPLQKTISILSEFLQVYELSRPLFFGHGDLCFNNILVDPTFITAKLIDPRVGIVSKEKDVGLIDPYYEYAKLNHSFTCYYDSIVNQLYKLSSITANQIKLEIFKPNDQEFISNVFEQNFFESPKDKKEISLITSSLFLSMLPIHIEDPQRVTALSLIGSRICHEFIES